MASIRLFGRGRNAAAASTPGVSAAQIADVLAGLETAALSTTWRCRHGAGTSLGEGAVDFGTRRSRSTVIRGKSTYEYVRSGSRVYRSPVDMSLDGIVAEEVEEDEPVAEADADDVAEGEDAAEAVQESAGEDAGADVFVDSEKDDGRVWESFSEHDACGVHAYAEMNVLAAAVRAAGTVQVRDSEQFGEENLSAYAVTLKPKPADPDKLIARLARQLRDHGANMLVVTAFADDSDWDEDADAPTEGEGGPRIVRLRIDLPHWTPADDPTADHAVSVDLFEFGEPVEIDVPGEAKRRTMRSCADLALF
jgi:hypothetical protein